MKRLVLMLPIIFSALVSSAATGSGKADADAKARIAASFPGVSAEDVRPSPIPGLYEVTAGPIVVYASADGRYLFRGEIHDMKTDRNLTEERTRQARASTLEKLDEDELIIFGKADAKHSVTVFTDVDCTYCRVLHSKIDEYLSRGIRVRYAAFPRNGMASETWQTMEQVWCAADPKKALTLAKLDREFEPGSCGSEEVVSDQWQLGRMLGVRGTPAIFTRDGQMIPGYLPPDELLKRLQAKSNN